MSIGPRRKSICKSNMTKVGVIKNPAFLTVELELPEIAIEMGVKWSYRSDPCTTFDAKVLVSFNDGLLLDPWSQNIPLRLSQIILV